MKNLFVGGMHFDTTENDLRVLFDPFGVINRIQVITDRDTGRSRGFAFVEMADDDAAAKAIGALNAQELHGRTLKVSEANPKPESKGKGRGQPRQPHWGPK